MYYMSTEPELPCLSSRACGCQLNALQVLLLLLPLLWFLLSLLTILPCLPPVSAAAPADRSKLEKDVKALVASLNIQFDNLCQFLPQDKVVEFARMDHYELLKATEKAIGDASMYEKHQQLISKRQEVQDQSTVRGLGRAPRGRGSMPAVVYGGGIIYSEHKQLLAEKQEVQDQRTVRGLGRGGGV